MFDPGPAPEWQAEEALDYTVRTWAPLVRSTPSPAPLPDRIPVHPQAADATSRGERHRRVQQLRQALSPRTPTARAYPTPTGSGYSDDIAEWPRQTFATNG